MCVLALSSQSCPTLCNSMDCSPSGSSVHGILQVRILEFFHFLLQGNLPDPVLHQVQERCEMSSLARYWVCTHVLLSRLSQATVYQIVPQLNKLYCFQTAMSVFWLFLHPISSYTTCFLYFVESPL